jgi:hypothetical protein
MHIRKSIAGAILTAALVAGLGGTAQAEDTAPTTKRPATKVANPSSHRCDKAELKLGHLGRAKVEMERVRARFEQLEAKASDAGRTKLADKLHAKVERLNARIARAEAQVAKIRAVFETHCPAAPAAPVAE